MEERKVVEFKKKEFAMKEYIKNSIGKGKISRVEIKYTPIGEKIIISTHRPGLVIGRGGEKINEIMEIIKKKFELENPQIEIEEIKNPEFDARIVAEDIALALEKNGPLKFKVIAYKTLQKIMNAGALGAEIVLSGKLPSSRARVWRFSQGYLKKTGESTSVVDKAKATAQTRPGIIGIKVSIIAPGTKLKGRIELDEEKLNKIKEQSKEVLKNGKN